MNAQVRRERKYHEDGQVAGLFIKFFGASSQDHSSVFIG